MKKIRKSVFETNSSSSHVLHIDEETELMDTSLVPNEDGVINITPNTDYGWEYCKYNTALDKIMYSIVDQGNNENRMDMLREVIMEQTGAKEVMLNTNPDCYIDHESYGTSMAAFDTKDTLRNFIFNRKCAIFTGNDNSNAPKNFYCDETTAVYKVRLVPIVENRNNVISTILDEEKEELQTKNEWMYSLHHPKNDNFDFYEYKEHFFHDFAEDDRGWFKNYDTDNKTIIFEDYENNKQYKYIVEVELNDKRDESLPV